MIEIVRWESGGEAFKRTDYVTAEEPLEIRIRGRGIGYARYKTVATYNAVIAEVEIDKATGRIRVPRVWNAVDAGLIISPDGLTNQIEGGIIQSTSWTLHEHVRFDRNGIKSRDWASYPILTMPDVPKIETVLMERTLLRHPIVWAGAGSDRHMVGLAPAELGRLARARPVDVVEVEAYDSNQGKER